MSIDILLINPPFRLAPPFQYKLIDPPRNVALLASALRMKGYSVEILDMPILELDFESIIPVIERTNPKIIGISNRSTYSFPIVQKVAAIIKTRFSEIKVIVGGTYVSFAPVDALRKEPSIDVVVIGEGENTICSLAEILLKNGNISSLKGIAFRTEQGEIIRNEDSELIEDLSTIPLPALQLLPIQRYVARNERYILDISRGCAFRCSYCTSSYVKNKIRFRTKEQVLEEIEVAYTSGFRNFYFFDDLFTANKQLVSEICKEIIARNYVIKWPCMTRITMVDREILSWMKKAGCDLIAYGVETTSKEYLNSIGKLDQLKKIEDVFELTRNCGIRPLAFVIFGLPKVKFHEELETISFLNQIRPDAVGVFSFKPYPGTIYFSNPEQHGIKILDYNLSRWSQLDEPTHETEFLTKDEIIETMMVCNYLFRSGGTFSISVKYRRRRGVMILKTREGGLLYNPYLPPEKRKTDMYLNAVKLNKEYFEVLYRCDGYHNVEDIADVVQKLFDYTYEASIERVHDIIDRALDLKLLDQVPDIMNNTIPVEAKAVLYGGGLV